MTGKLDHLLQTYTHGLLLAGRQWRRAANSVAETHGLTDATALPLILIGRSAGHPRQNALAEAVGIEGPSLVRLLDQLQAAGLVVRMEDPTDRRAKVLSLTPDGKRIVTLMEAELDALRTTVFADIDASDLETGLRGLQGAPEPCQRRGGRREPQGGRRVTLPGRGDWVFAIKTYMAAMLALYLAMWIDLPRPYWALGTVYITSQVLAGATPLQGPIPGARHADGRRGERDPRSNLANAPEFLTVAIALWVAV